MDAWHTLADRDQVLEDMDDCDFLAHESSLAAFATAPTRKKAAAAARREATATEKRQFAKQFLDAKQAELRSSWQENDVYDLVDLRNGPVTSYITGRWGSYGEKLSLIHI
eukprot:12061412-Prorocentrum_lima.AAC.2